MKERAVVEGLRKAGYRMTALRRWLLEILPAEQKPLSAIEIHAKAKQASLSVNLTTIYREIDMLLKEELIVLVDVQRDAKRYEWIGGEGHHHHLVCSSCHTVEHVDLEESLQKLETSLAKQHAFKIVAHTVEFFGFCRNCVSA